MGSPVAAYWSEAWYRGTVTHLEQLVLGVLFVDYGNTDTVPRDCVRAALEEELLEPPLAVRYNVYPNLNTPEHCQNFQPNQWFKSHLRLRFTTRGNEPSSVLRQLTESFS